MRTEPPAALRREAPQPQGDTQRRISFPTILISGQTEAHRPRLSLFPPSLSASSLFARAFASPSLSLCSPSRCTPTGVARPAATRREALCGTHLRPQRRVAHPPRRRRTGRTQQAQPRRLRREASHARRRTTQKGLANREEAIIMLIFAVRKAVRDAQYRT